MELVYKHPGNVTKKFQKDISCRTKDIKQFSQLTTDRHTHTQTDKCKSRADPTRGGSAKNMEPECTRDQLSYQNQDQDAKPQTGFSSVLKSPKIDDFN